MSENYRMKVRLWIVAALIVSSAQSFAASDFHLSDIFLQTTGRVNEPSQGGFDSPQFKLAVEDKISPSLTLSATLGSSNLLYQPRWVTAQSGMLALVEAQALIRTSVTDITAGQFLIPFGIEGMRQERDLFFPRSYLFEQGLLPMRDYGLLMNSRSDGFYFSVAAHTGEGGGFTGTNDNRIFTTGQWGFESPTHEAIGISVTEGRTLQSGALTETRLRGGNVFVAFNFVKIGFEIEGSVFQTTVGLTETNYSTWHGDIFYRINDHVGILARFEQYNPNTRLNSAIYGRAYGGLEFLGLSGQSRVFVYAVRQLETPQDIPNDQALIVWRVTPNL